MTWTVQVGPWSAGPDIELTDTTSRSLRASLKTPSELSISMSGDSPQALRIHEFVTDAWLLNDGKYVFRGRCVSSQDDVAVANTFNFTFKDYRYVLSRRILYPDAFSTTPPGGLTFAGPYAGVLQEDIVRQLLSYAQAKVGGNLNMTYVLPTTGIKLSIAGFQQGDKIATDIDLLANLVFGVDPSLPKDVGFDWDIEHDPSGNGLIFTMYWPWRGSDNGITLDYLGTAKSATRDVQDGEFGNAIYQSGGTQVPSIELTAPDLAYRAEGRWDLAFPLPVTLSTPTGQASVGAHNLRLAAQFQPAYTFTISDDKYRKDSLWTKDWLWLGDTVTYVINRGRLANISGTTRVYEIAIDLDASNKSTVRITVGKPKPTLSDNLDSLLAMGDASWYLRRN